MKPFLSLFFGLMGVLLNAQSAKVALIVAVGNYSAASGWPPIHSTNDVDLIRSALLRQGFSPELIFELKDAAATRMGILNALEDLRLNRINPGDQVVFHFSGHGQQLRDNNGDELDGYDETIVPFDSPMQFKKGVYEGENLIRDDELGIIFSKIRKKLGAKGHFLLIMDSCHSGTGSRGIAFSRGTDHKMADSTWIKRNEKQKPVAEHTQFSNKESARLAPMAAFYGAAANQLNYETQDRQGKPVGSLSNAFCTAMSNVSTQTTYRGLFEQIRLTMAWTASKQTPQAEGALDRLVLNGEMVEQAPYFTLKSAFESEGVAINGGWMHGLTEGSVVGFFPPETRDAQTATPYLKGLVVESRPLHCVVQPQGDLSISLESIQAAWVILIEQQAGDLQLHLQLKMPDGPLKSELIERIGTQKALSLVTEKDAVDLTILQNGNSLELIGPDEQTLTQVAISPNTTALTTRLLREIKNAGQVKFLRSLSAPVTSNDLKMELIPVEVNEKEEEVRRFPITEFTGPDGLIRFPEGTYIKIKVSNPGILPAYFTLIDIEPYQRFTIVAPEEGSSETAEEYRIAPGAQLEIPKVFRVAPPYGQEMFKLIFTRNPIDLRSIKASNGAIRRGIANATSLEKLFSDSFFTEELQSRGGQTTRTSPGEMGVFSLNFMIEPKG